jgi:hypothetical protein
MLVSADVLLACLSVQGVIYWMTHPTSEMCESRVAPGTMCVCKGGLESPHCVSGPVSSCERITTGLKVSALALRILRE